MFAMCVAAIAWSAHPRWQLVVAGNRDEFHARPTAALARWDEGLLAGRDLEAGGTWMGIAPGRFALVTNRRAEGWPRPGMASRGGLVSGWLLGEEPAQMAAMNPFNLFLADQDQARMLSNFPEQSHDVPRGSLLSLSNSDLAERWFKAGRIESGLMTWLGGEEDPEALLAALADEVRDPADPDAIHSSVFIRNPTYGTRASSVIAIDQAGRGVFIERSFDAEGEETGTVRLEFDWS